MRLLVSWLRDFVEVKESPEEIAEKLSLRGFEVAAIEPVGRDDAVIDFEIAANRPDCLSVLGLAREVATAYGRKMTPPSASPEARVQLKMIPTGASDRVNVVIEDDELCPRYAAAVADLAGAASPAWMTERLQASGVRPISPIVDITNYVLLEIGQPMHAFDLAALAGAQIRVRRARPGETLTTLDGIDRKLGPDMLVIADRDRAQAVAGVMGAAGSEVSPATTAIVFESAYFKPASVRRTSKQLGLKTEASARFERGADIDIPVLALRRAIALMEQVGAGRASPPLVDGYPRPRGPLTIHLRRLRLAGVLGAAVGDAKVEQVLRTLGMTVTAASDGWDAGIPSFRADLLREIDLIEEVGRHDGFDKLESTFPVLTQPAPAPDARTVRDRSLRQVLTAAGLSEAVTFGFIEAKAAQAFGRPDVATDVAIANPLSAKFDTLRSSLLPGLVDAVARNRRHGRRDVRLFEIGARFEAGGESRGVAIAWTGAGADEHWSGGAREVDFFDVKGVVELLCQASGATVGFRPARQRFLVPGQDAAVVSDTGTVIGIVGQVTPAVADGCGLPRQDRVFVAEVNLDELERARIVAADATRPLPRYPFVVRDVSLVVPDALPAVIIRGTIQAAGANEPAPLAGVSFFDRYHGKGMPEGRVSLSVRLTFQAADRTLTDAEVQQSFDAILAALVREHGALQR